MLTLHHIHSPWMIDPKMTDPNRKLQPGDLISVDPTAVVTLQRPRESPASSSASSSDAAAAEPTTSEAATTTAESAPESESSTPPPPSPSAGARPLPFHLPDYAAPFLFIPPYIEPSFQTCSAVYLRHPTARPGVSEIPSPYEADGEVMRLAWVRRSRLLFHSLAVLTASKHSFTSLSAGNHS
jgi:hypothetical protein